jgi:hypothetical protein
MKITPRRHQHPLSGANRPSEIAVTVNFNAECNLIAVNPILEFFSSEFVPEYCHGLESSMVYTVTPFVVESIHGHSNRSVPCLPLHMHAGEVIPTFLTSSLYIGQCLPTAPTVKQLRVQEMLEVLLIVRLNDSVGLWGILKFRHLRDTIQ